MRISQNISQQVQKTYPQKWKRGTWCREWFLIRPGSCGLHLSVPRAHELVKFSVSAGQFLYKCTTYQLVNIQPKRKARQKCEICFGTFILNEIRIFGARSICGQTLVQINGRDRNGPKRYVHEYQHRQHLYNKPLMNLTRVSWDKWYLHSTAWALLFFWMISPTQSALITNCLVRIDIIKVYSE